MTEPPQRDLEEVLRDPARLAAMHQSGLLDSLPEDAFDRHARLAAALAGTPTSMVSLLDEDRQVFKGAVGVEEPWASRRGTPLSHSFCKHVVHSGEPLVVVNARVHPLLHDNPAVDDLHAVAYVGVPLVTVDHHTIGTLCVLDTKPRAWTEQDVSQLQDLAAGVMCEIELRTVKAKIERLGQARSAWLAAASHGFRTPLTGIQGLSEILRDEDLSPEEIKEFAQDINRSAVKLGQIVEDLLDRGGAETGEGYS